MAPAREYVDVRFGLESINIYKEQNTEPEPSPFEWLNEIRVLTSAVHKSKYQFGNHRIVSMRPGSLQYSAIYK